MLTKCHKCSNDVPDAKRDCPACGADNGFPNVRLAEKEAETTALAVRMEQAQISANAANYMDVLQDFQAAIGNSKAIISRSLAVLQDLIENENKTFTSYQLELAGQARNPQNNQFDKVRTQFESALFPNFHQEIRFAALALDGRGLSGYGPYGIVLKDAMIEHRTAVFEENPYVFVNKHGLLMSDSIPAGFRATWANRGELAAAKLYPKLTMVTKPPEYPSVLITDTGDTGTCDYIEVHIYGPFNRHAIEKVVGPKPRTKEDRLIWKKLGKMLGDVGATLEEI